MSDWGAETAERGERFVRYVVTEAGAALGFARACELWARDLAFRVFFDALLASAPFEALRWETPALTSAARERPFEFVLVDSPDLLGPPDPEPFAEHFAAAPPGAVIDFVNLGGDARLVVPCPGAARAGPEDFGHLAAFQRSAPAAQRLELWRAVGEAVLRRLGPRPVWVSTAGGGVAWLHVRLDDRPKYYVTAPYRAAGHAATEPRP